MDSSTLSTLVQACREVSSRRSTQISASQSNRQLRERRAALLEQVGLREAAAFDRSGN